MPRFYRPVNKLFRDGTDINHYFTRYRNLKFYVEWDMKDAKTTKGVIFKQNERLKPYIDLNTEL